MDKLICFFIGHKIADETDGGYEHCKRCGMHEYYDGYDSDSPDFYLNIPTIFYKKWWRFKWWLSDIAKPYFQKCADCGKIERFCGKSVGNHEKCLPF